MADAGQAADLILEVVDHPVTDIDPGLAVGGVGDADDHEQIGVGLGYPTPCCWTWVGSREIAAWIAFCTCTWAMSGSTPLSNTALIPTDPLELEFELK